MKNNFLRCIFLFLISFFLVASIRAGYYMCTDGFSLTRIENRITPNPSILRINPSSFQVKNIQKICKEPFFYLKKGSQAYAFYSKSSPYILKLYKCHHLQPADWLYTIPFPSALQDWKKKLIDRRKYKLDLALSSFSIAQKILKNECGIFFSQVLPNSSYLAETIIVDGIGRKYNIDIAQYGYALQKKAQLIFPMLNKWIEVGDIESAKKALSSLIGLMSSRSQKGIQDSDPDLHKNAGFVGTTAIFIDIGSFHMNPKIKEKEEMKRDIEKISRGLIEWLKTRNAELTIYLQSLLEAPWLAHWTPIEEGDHLS